MKKYELDRLLTKTQIEELVFIMNGVYEYWDNKCKEKEKKGTDEFIGLLRSWENSCHEWANKYGISFIIAKDDEPSSFIYRELFRIYVEYTLSGEHSTHPNFGCKKNNA